MLCDSCGKKASFTHICTSCKGRYCKDHRDPKDHKCTHVIIEHPLDDKTDSEIAQEQIELEPEVIHENDISIPEVSQDILVDMQEEELEDQTEESEFEIKKSDYRVYQGYKDFKSGRRDRNYRRSSNLGKVLQTLGKWIVVTGSFYVILYSLFKLMNFMTTYRIS